MLGNLAFVALAVPAFADVVQDVDDAVHRAMVETEWSPLVAIANVLDFLGSVWATAPLMVLVALYIALRTRWEAMISSAGAMVASQLLIGPVEELYERERPPLPLVETSGFSFPSGHAVAGAAIAIAMVLVLVPAGPKRRNLAMLAAVFAITMALSRVYLRAHWVSDVAAGVALGAAVAVAAAATVHSVDERTRRT